MDINKIMPSEEHKVSLQKNISKIKNYIISGGHGESSKQVTEVVAPNPLILSYKNISTVLEKRRKNGKYSVDPYVMRAVVGTKIFDETKGAESLLKANKVALKAKSVFIHLSTLEEGDLLYVNRFIRAHPFNEFIPEIVQFLTQDHPSVSCFSD